MGLENPHNVYSLCSALCYDLRYSPIRVSVTYTLKMASPVIETCHVACCANRTPHVVSWSRSGVIAFGSCNSVALYDPQVLFFLTFHPFNFVLGGLIDASWHVQVQCVNVCVFLYSVCINILGRVIYYVDTLNIFMKYGQ